jgi:hypothetical protein
VNRLQIARQVKYLLQQATWPDAAVVFPTPCVLVTMGLWQNVLQANRLPLAIVRPGAVVVDPKMAGESTQLVRIEFAVSILVATSGDQYGETTLVGANRGGGGSKGRGLLEVEEKMMAVLFQLGPASGLPIIFRGASQAQPTYDESLGYVAFGDYRFEATGTTDRTYQPPAGLKRTGSGSSVALSWNQRTRWDFRRFVLRRAAGATPPATTASGTGVTLGGSPDGGGTTPPTSVTDTPGAGTYSYSLFQIYDDTDSGTDVAASPPQTLSSLVVT